MLKARWPGIYIPSVPDKKMVGSKEEKVVDERRQLFEDFLKDCAKYDYIINSSEFRIFARGPGEVDVVLKGLQR